MHSSRMRTTRSSSCQGVSTRHPPLEPGTLPPGPGIPQDKTALGPDPPEPDPPGADPPRDQTLPPGTRHPPVDRILEARF